MRSIKEIYSDLVDAEREYSDACEEIDHQKTNRDDAQSYIAKYSRELEEAKLANKET